MDKTSKKMLLNYHLIFEAIKSSFSKLNPLAQIKTPVIFVTYIGALVTTICTFTQLHQGHHFAFNLQVSLWLWFTVLFANFAEAYAESQGKAVALNLQKSQLETYARVLVNGEEQRIHASDLVKGNVVICEAGDIIPGDGEVIEGIATVDESAITGESAPVIRESGGDRSAVTIGTKIVSDKIIVLITSEPGHSFLDRMISLIEGAKRQKTPNEISLNIILSGLTLIFLMVVVSLPFFSHYQEKNLNQEISYITVPILTGLFICLIPTTISGLLSAVGIAGMDRLIHRNVIAKSGRAVEAAGDVDVLLLDKTGTITLGNRMATEFFPSPGVSEKDLAEAAQLASLSDETPEGRSIVVLAKDKFQLRGEALSTQLSKFYPFTAATRISGIDTYDEKGNVLVSIRKGAVDAVKAFMTQEDGPIPIELTEKINEISMMGATPLLVSYNHKVLGLVILKDIMKGGIRERFIEMRHRGIRTIMVTGDNPLTAAAIAAESGVDDFISEATPEMKLERIKSEQMGGHLVAMAGDGTNDAPALAQADVGMAMNTGTQASREAGNMVDLDSNPTKLIEIVEIGKQLLMTRGALTTFSIANDVAKYFAILPAIFGSIYATQGEKFGPLTALNIMHLSSPHSAILSSVIFNALIIIALIPLALKGVNYKSQKASTLLVNNLFIFGLGGLGCPFIMIKVIDLIISHMGIIK